MEFIGWIVVLAALAAGGWYLWKKYKTPIV